MILEVDYLLNKSIQVNNSYFRKMSKKTVLITFIVFIISTV